VGTADVLERSVNNNKTPDLGFIEIFANDIQILRDENFPQDKIAPLTRQLEKVADKMTDASQSAFRDVKVPLMRPQQDLGEVAVEYMNQSEVGKGLLTLSEQYDVCRIKGDGHCLFRAAGAGYLRELLGSGNQNELLEKLQKSINDFPGLEKEVDRLKGLWPQLKEKNLDVDRVMNDKEQSDAIVQFLRKAVAEWLKKNKTEAFEAMALSYGFDSLDAYLESVKKKELGGEAELIALSNILGARLHVLDALQISRGREIGDPSSYIGPDDAGATLNLLYRPGHYDILIPKSG
jgi:hypothetical protein